MKARSLKSTFLQACCLLLFSADVALAKDGPLQPSPELHGKVEEVKALVDKLVNEGYDPSPIGKLMELAGKALDKEKDAVEAEKLVDEALALARKKDDLKRPRPAGSPQEIQARLEGKLKMLQERVATLISAGKQPTDIPKKMAEFEPLMKEGEVLKAERVLDDALELAKGE